jgi:adenylate cyclase
MEPLARLQCIDEICRNVLEDELCRHLAESDSEADGDFLSTIREMRELCDKGSQFLRAAFGKDSEAQAGAISMEQVHKDVHGFKNLIAGITYRCQFLCEQNDERFLPFAEDIGEVRRQFSACMAAVDEARGLEERPSAQLASEGPARVADEISADSPSLARRPGVKSPEAPTGPAPDLETGHILVVDDEEECREYLARELEKRGHAVTAVEDSRQALELLERHCYLPDAGEIDLVLLDLRLRERSGCEVLDEIKKDYGMRFVPVVMVSASSDIESMVQCIGAGADDYLTKPFEPKLLLARVASCLAKRKLHKREQVLTEQIRAAKQRADNLLYDIFPYTVAEELITSGAVKPRGCDHVAVMFCDVVGFTSYCCQRSPAEVVAHLDELFSAYEEAVRQYSVEKIKTIGDCMMITAGLMRRFDNPVLACLRCGAMMIEAARRCSAHWEVRIGIHVGPVVAGMAGNKHYAFDVWGDTVNTTSRVERTADPGTISVSEPAWAQVYQYCRGRSLGVQPLKGKNSMEVFRFDGLREAPGEVQVRSAPNLVGGRK